MDLGQAAEQQVRSQSNRPVIGKSSKRTASLRFFNAELKFFEV
jgi:hypothetical protein